MFDIGFSEMLLIAVVALIAIGPEDLPGILFRMGRFMRQIRLFMGNVRNQYADIMHEAEVDHYRKQLDSLLPDEDKADREAGTLLESPVIPEPPQPALPEKTDEFK